MSGKLQADREDRAREKGYVGCTPLLPGDLFLATGMFQELLQHRTLPYSEAANVDEVLKRYPAVCPESIAVFRSAYPKYFDKTKGKLPDRSVITWRRIENHVEGCPEVMQSGPAESTTPRAPEAAPPPGRPGPVLPPGPPPPELQAPASAPLPDEPPPPFPDQGPEPPLSAPTLGPLPEVPTVAPDKALSPDQVHQEAYVGQVASVEMFLKWCRLTIDNFEKYMQGSSDQHQVRIRETLRELAAKVRQGENAQAMAEVSLEAAGSLCIFVVIMFNVIFACEFTCRAMCFAYVIRSVWVI